MPESAAALPARARRNRPKGHQDGGPPHPHSRDTTRTSRPPTRATSGPASQAPSRAPRLSLHPQAPTIPEFFMPTQEEFDLQVRRRAVGHSTIAEICGDLAVVPGLLHPRVLEQAVRAHALLRRQGRDCDAGKVRPRAGDFIQEQNKKPDSTWEWMRLKPDELRQVLGFFIGEPPVDPFEPLATGPP